MFDETNSKVAQVKPFTLLNSEAKISKPKTNIDSLLTEENSVPNRIQPRKQPGIYMVRCILNDWRYYGESKNVSGRLSSHRSLLNRKIHPNIALQVDWNTYGAENFDFIVLFMGESWDEPTVRRGKELELIIMDRALSYNILEGISKPGEKNPFWGKLQTPETKKKISEALKGKPNDKLGRKISILGIFYPSLAEASRQTGIARKTIRKKLDDIKDTDFFAVEDSGTVERPS
uniref:Putative site-specific DNA endonuclease n=1 Tax=Tupiella akineta TaxID=160070 RepID=Q3ZJ55_TUPAK|nr:putative site-specific DNA endonuclease [Tupiella akineta]AAV80636.1 putative site-specific DNA endonuclease [Tupiella akineta]